MSFEDRLRDDLHAVPVPPLPVPDRLADKALTGARRQNRLRGVAVAGVTTLAVATAVPVLRGLLPAGGTALPSAPPTPAICGPDGSLAARPPAQNWEYFDPLTYAIDASGVTGYQVSAYSTGTYFQVAELTNPTGDRRVTVTLYAAGGVPHYKVGNTMPAPFDPAEGTPTDPVNGAPAYLLPNRSYSGQPSEVGIAWQWSPGAWVLVTAADTSGQLPVGAPTGTPATDLAELYDLAAEVAPDLVLGVDTPVTSPFSLPLPDCTQVSYTTVEHATSPTGARVSRFRVTFTMGGEAESDNPLLLPSLTIPLVWVTADTGATATEATSVVDGHPASFNGCEGSAVCDSVTVYDVDGLALTVTLSTELGTSALDVFHTVQVYPGAATNPDAWGDLITP
jgi:hypothetical protein